MTIESGIITAMRDYMDKHYRAQCEKTVGGLLYAVYNFDIEVHFRDYGKNNRHAVDDGEIMSAIEDALPDFITEDQFEATAPIECGEATSVLYKQGNVWRLRGLAVSSYDVSYDEGTDDFDFISDSFWLAPVEDNELGFTF